MSSPIDRHSSTATIEVLSINSSMLGRNSFMIELTARPAAPMSENTATTVAGSGGIGLNRSRAIVTMPNVPSLPTIKPVRS